MGESGEKIHIPALKCKTIKATGRGDRQLWLVDKNGFPRSKAASLRTAKGFKTGDLAEATVPSGKKTGIHKGKVAVRSSDSFNISTKKGIMQGIYYKYIRKLHVAEGYSC